MEAFSLKQRLIMTGMKSNSLPKIAIGGNSSPAHSENMENTVYVTFSQPASAKVQRAHSLYTIAPPGSNEYRSNILVNLLSSTSNTTQMEYAILDHSEEATPATPSISVSELATGPGSKTSWRVGMAVMGILLAFIMLTVIILGIYFAKREEMGTPDQLVGIDVSLMNQSN